MTAGLITSMCLIIMPALAAPHQPSSACPHLDAGGGAHGITCFCKEGGHVLGNGAQDHATLSLPYVGSGCAGGWVWEWGEREGEGAGVQTSCCHTGMCTLLASGLVAPFSLSCSAPSRSTPGFTCVKGGPRRRAKAAPCSGCCCPPAAAALPPDIPTSNSTCAHLHKASAASAPAAGPEVRVQEYKVLSHPVCQMCQM